METMEKCLAGLDVSLAMILHRFPCAVSGCGMIGWARRSCYSYAAADDVQIAGS